jgi:hypothetical protein
MITAIIQFIQPNNLKFSLNKNEVMIEKLIINVDIRQKFVIRLKGSSSNTIFSTLLFLYNDLVSDEMKNGLLIRAIVSKTKVINKL